MTRRTIADVTPDATRYVWLGRDYVGGSVGYVESDAPEPGDTVWMGQFDGMANCGDHSSGQYALTLAGEREHTPVFYREIPYTGSGDYSGSAVDAANRRELLESYPDTFVILDAGMGYRALLLPEAQEFDDDQTDVLDVIAALADYPLVNDEAHTFLVDEWAQESWDSWLGSDVESDLSRALDDYPRALETLEQWSESGRLRERFYALTYAANYGPEDEGMGERNIRFPFLEQTVTAIRAEILASLAPEYVARQLSAAGFVRGQIALDGGESA